MFPIVDKNAKIWIWIQDNKLLKAIYKPYEKILTIYDENDQILIKRKGVTQSQIMAIAMVFLRMGAKRIDNHKEPFTYL